MAITFRDFERRKYLRQLELVAGAGGIDKPVATANIMDYEFILEEEIVNPFEQESIVVSSLLFARDRPELLLTAVKKLLELNVSGLAYETTIYQNLPDTVLKYADKNDFPIYRFPRAIMFENVIFEIMDAVQSEDMFILSEDRIDDAITDRLTPSDIAAIKNGLSMKFKKYTGGIYISEKKREGRLQGGTVFKNRYLHKDLRDKHILFKYKDGMFMLTTFDSMNESKHRVAVKNALEILDIDAHSMHISYSNIHNSADELHLCMREGYYANVAARIEGRSTLKYQDIGIYKCLIPLCRTSGMRDYMNSYLGKLIDKETLLETAIDYVLAGGDIVQVAEKHICHVNTIRYRIGKIKELTGDSSCTETDFYTHITVAVRLYLLQSFYTPGPEVGATKALFEM